MQLAALGDLDLRAQQGFDAGGERLAGVPAVHQDFLNQAQTALVQVEGLQVPSAVGHIRRGDVDRMGQAVGVHRDVPLDAAHLLAAVIALLPRRVGVLDALRVHDQKARLRLPPMALPGLANRIFLKPHPEGSAVRPASRSTCGSRRTRCSSRGGRRAPSAIGNRFSARTGRRRIGRTGRARAAWFSSAPTPKGGGLPQTVRG